MKNILINNLEEMKSFASKVAKLAHKKDVITFQGNLGVGKTCFCQYFIQSILENDIEVTSPTFNLVHIYDKNDLSIWHFDLYRLNHSEEIYEIGIEEALCNSISLIEWPQKIIDILPKNRLDLYLDFTTSPGQRIINVSGSNQWIEKI